MFHVKNHKQAHIFDPWGHLGPKRRKLLDKSWSGLFQQQILPTLPVEALRKHYDDWNGRPTKELYSMIGLMILQQMHDLTDKQAVKQFCFNIQWHLLSILPVRRTLLPMSVTSPSGQCVTSCPRIRFITKFSRPLFHYWPSFSKRI